MSKAKQPVSVAGIEFDALISETRTYEATVPEYAVETGFVVSDDIILGSEKLDMTLYLTDTPVTWRQHAGQGRVESVIQQLEELYYKKEPVTIVTSEKTFTEMAITSISISKSLEVGYAREIPISFQKIRVTSAKTASIPDSYGKSGKTQAAAGTANTSTSTAVASVSAGSGASGSGSGSGSSGHKSRKSSILYGAAKSIGLIN